MSSTAERLVRFSTDAFGLERILRLVQAIVQIVVAVPLLSLRLTDHINSLPHQAAGVGAGPGPGTGTGDKGPAPLAVADTVAMLGDLRGRLNMTRRVLRLFRFAEAFHGAQKLYFSSTTTTGKSLELWLDISARGFNGMYYLLETATLPDALGVPHLPRVFGPEAGGALAVEAQRFWLLALACSAASGALKVLGTYGAGAVPGTGAAAAAGLGGDAVGEKEGEEEEEEGERKKRREEEEEGERKKRREEEKAKVKAAQQANAAKRRVCLRKMVADLLDIALPGSALGWVPLDALSVSSAMLLTSILTGLDFWERCA
ncbi:hypothetical protein RB594_001927 [Gaeumannomyces avenae]